MSASRIPAPTAENVQCRFDFIDTAKAVGIVLVVLGHAADTPVPVAVLVYSFHMPLFFFVSGYLLAPERLTVPLRATAARAAHSLLVPYVFFFAVSLIYWLLTRDIGERSLKFSHLGVADALRGLLTALSSDLFVNPPLWFFPALFTCTLLYAAARKLLTPALCFAAALGGAVIVFSAFAPLQKRWPWGLDIASMAMVFYAAGHWIRCARPVSSAKGPMGRAERTGLIALLVLWLAFAWQEGRVDLAMANFGLSPSIYIACAMAGIALLVLLARRAPATASARWLSDNAIVIFPLHALVMNFASGVLKFVQPGWTAGGHGAFGTVLFTAWGIAAVVPVAFVMNRHFPVLLGRRGAR